MGFETITGPDCLCCDRSGGGGGGCTTGTITVCANQSCNAAIGGIGTVTGVSGVAVTITETFAPFSVFTGTTDATGCFVQGGLPPGVYSISVSFGGSVQTGSVTIDSACDPVGTGFTYAGSTLGIFVTGCGPTVGISVPTSCQAGLAGVSVTVVQSGTTIGSGTTDSSGNLYIHLSRPSDGTNFTITYSLPTYFNDVVNTVAGTSCNDSAHMNFAGTKPGWVCCYGDLPYPTTMTATVPLLGAVTITWTPLSGSWIGCATAPVPGYDNLFCAGVPMTINQAFFVVWSCGGIQIYSRVCTAGGGSTVANTLTLIACSRFDLATVHIDSFNNLSTSTCDPFFSTGVFPVGTALGFVDFAGTWTVTP